MSKEKKISFSIRLKKVLDFKRKIIVEEEAAAKLKELELRAKGVKV